MKSNLKTILFSAFLTLGMLFSANTIAQSSSCCGGKSNKQASCETSTDTTSGCLPSACRGEKTKFGEAKVISNLRLNLIDVKANMEKSKKTSFDKRSYDIHGIVGKTDIESVAIIVREIKIVEKAFAEKLNYKVTSFKLPENRAKQIAYLNNRIERVKKLL